MLNPEEARLINNNNIIDDQEISGEILIDKTMRRLIEILQQSNFLPLDGRLHIYNPFSLQNSSSKDALRQENWLQEVSTGNVEIMN